MFSLPKLLDYITQYLVEKRFLGVLIGVLTISIRFLAISYTISIY